MEKHSAPLPPPPPPLPPPSSSMDAFSRCVQKRVTIRKFNWDTIPCERVVGKRNLWTMQASLDNIELNTDRIKELFSSKDNWHSSTMTLSKCNLSPLEDEIQKASLLGSKKNMNLAILLRQFKRPIYRLVRDIQEGNSMAFKGGTLKELLKLLPDKEEVQKLQAYDGPLSHLEEAEQLMVRLVRLPGYRERVQGIVLIEEFFPIMDNLRKLTSVMTAAAKELLESEDLQSIIHLVLKVGNYMNKSCYTGSVIGFKMASLLRLADTKANEPGMNLIHYVAMQAQDIDPDLLGFPQRFKHINRAARINSQEVHADFQTEMAKVAKFKEDSNSYDDLKSQMENFLMRADLTLAGMDMAWREFQDAKNFLAEYLCEDPSSFKLEECCFIFKSFGEKFNQAVKENQKYWKTDARGEQREKSSLAPHGSLLTDPRVLRVSENDMERALTSLLLGNRGGHRRRPNLNQSSGSLSSGPDGLSQRERHRRGR